MSSKKEGELIEDYIRKQLDKGFSISKIKDTLVDVGHPESLILESIRNMGLSVKKGKSYLKVLLVAVIIISGAFFMMDGWKGILPEEETEVDSARQEFIDSCVITYDKEVPIGVCAEIKDELNHNHCVLNKIEYRAITEMNSPICESDLISFFVNASERKDWIEKCKLFNPNGFFEQCVKLYRTEEGCKLGADLVDREFIDEDDKEIGKVIKIISEKLEEDEESVWDFLAKIRIDVKLCENVKGPTDKQRCKLSAETDSMKVREGCAKLYGLSLSG